MAFVAAKIGLRKSIIKIKIYYSENKKIYRMNFSIGFFRHFKIDPKFIQFYYDTDSDKIGFKFHATNPDKKYLKINNTGNSINVSIKGFLIYCNLDINNYSGNYNSDAIIQENNMFILDPSKRITK